jgi:hypothetical protein
MDLEQRRTEDGMDSGNEYIPSNIRDAIAYVLGLSLFMMVSLSIVLAGASLLDWKHEERNAEFQKEQIRVVTSGVQLTAKGCPAVASKVREIGSDGVYSKREVEIMMSLVTIEQAKPEGLTTCQAPSWNWYWGGWVVSSGYVD